LRITANTSPRFCTTASRMSAVRSAEWRDRNAACLRSSAQNRPALCVPGLF
jgi:hypothetical protein